MAYKRGEHGAQEAEAQAPAAAPPPPAAPQDPTAGKITELAQLHSSGALTDDEFAAAKAKALGI